MHFGDIESANTRLQATDPAGRFTPEEIHAHEEGVAKRFMKIKRRYDKAKDEHNKLLAKFNVGRHGAVTLEQQKKGGRPNLTAEQIERLDLTSQKVERLAEQMRQPDYTLGSRIMPVNLNIKNALEISDIGAFNDPQAVLTEVNTELVDRVDGWKSYPTDELGDVDLIKLLEESYSPEVLMDRATQQQGVRELAFDKMQADLESLGIDGLKYSNDFESESGAMSYVAFRPEQVKSATGNMGTYDTGNPDIRFMPQSKAFKSWFGDSKITNPDDSPKVVFHGTGAGTRMFGKDIPDFDAFDRQASGRKNFDNIGSWFTDNEGQASVFGTNVKPVYLSIKKPWVLDKKDLGKDPLAFLMEMVDDHGSGDEFHDFVKALDYDGIVIKNQKGDNFGKGDSDYYVALDPSQIKSATENSGEFDPDNPSYRMMPWKAMRGDPKVKYFQDNTRTPNIPINSIKTLSGQRVVVLEADRHDIRVNRMGGPLHPFLDMYDKTAVTVDGKKWKPVWANMKWTMVKGALNKVKNTTDGQAIISIMDDVAHRSNKQSFRKAMGKIQKSVGNMTSDERLMFAHMIDTAMTKSASDENKRQVLTKEQRNLAKAMSPVKSKLTNGDIKGHRADFLEKIEEYKKLDWWNDPFVAKIAKNFKNATKDSTFNQRAYIMEALMDFDHYPSIKQQLASEMDFRGADTDMAVAVVQLSKHKPDDAQNRIFAVYFGKDPEEAKFMSPKEIEVRDKLLAQKDFKKHPSYDWVMLGESNANNFVLDKQVDLDKLIPNYRKLHLQYKQKQLRDYTNKFISKGMQIYAKNGKFSTMFKDMKTSAKTQRNVIDGEQRVVVGAMKINGQVPIIIP